MAVKFGRADVARFGASFSAKEFIGWEIYASLEPFNELRADYRAALIAQTIANVNRSSEMPAYKLEEFLLWGNGSEEVVAPKEMTGDDLEAKMRIIFGVPSDFGALQPPALV